MVCEVLGRHGARSPQVLLFGSQAHRGLGWRQTWEMLSKAAGRKLAWGGCLAEGLLEVACLSGKGKQGWGS